MNKSGLEDFLILVFSLKDFRASARREHKNCKSSCVKKIRKSPRGTKAKLPSSAHRRHMLLMLGSFRVTDKRFLFVPENFVAQQLITFRWPCNTLNMT